MIKRRSLPPVLGLAAALLAMIAAARLAASANAPASHRPAGAAGTVVVPDHHLRRWDPVTIFFTRDVGPARGGPEDHPEKLVTCSPPHPGAFTWLDARTLQFRPAEPWPPLARFEWRVEGRSVPLITLMEPPVSTIPADHAEGLDPVESVTLTFAEPLDREALRRMLEVEVRPLPGIGAAETRWLRRDDFTIKAIERHARSENASYSVTFAHPIPTGRRAIVHLRLSLEDAGSDSFYECSFATAEPFRVARLGSRRDRYPVTPEGTRYTRDQAINGGSESRTVVVEFSAPPRDLGPVQARNLVRFTPAVKDLTFAVHEKTLEISGKFDWETLYRVDLVPTPISDANGRPLEMKGESEISIYFPRKPAYLKWAASQGIVERMGPQMVPVEGRGQERMDLRLYRIDPLDRSFWPFPERPVVVDESQRPPGPGEEPKPFAEPDRVLTPAELARELTRLGSPPVSKIVTLPLRSGGGAATFGLDLESELAYLGGRREPGTYLVGLRRLDGPSERSWMRIQVTDLSLTTLEEPEHVRFVVTSLSTGIPVPGAKVRVEGSLTEGSSPVRWAVLAEGETGTDGAFLWKAPGRAAGSRREATVRRITVARENDLLVLDPTRPPDNYADNEWSPVRSTWLQWTEEPLEDRGPKPEVLCHIFTERPVYRPEETVYIKGYLRRREKGHLTPVQFEGAFVVVDGPGDLSWKYPVRLSRAGSFDHAFAEKKLPTGTYTAHLENRKKERFGEVSFRMEAYRIPLFEVQLHSPDQVPLDREFSVSLTAGYYAGGRVAGRPLAWRVTQFPYAWTPKAREGFRYSSDGRYSRTEKFESTPTLERQETTDAEGSASLTLNPAIEPTAQPRSYVVEATVTGADDQTVTATRRVVALPPFVLGLKLPRYLERAEKIEPEIIAVGPDGELLAGKEITVRLLNRQWHSHLRASDFSEGVARYVTDVVDEKILEKKIQSGKEPVKLSLPVDHAGVYVVEIESRDKLGRAQVVSVDLYAGGTEAVAWEKPVTRVFSVAADRESYDPGMTAALVLKSPFQHARALAIVEAPEGNRYEWIPVEGGAATYHVPVLGTYVPRVPVHFVLMRGRVPGAGPVAGSRTDLGKPATFAATAWLAVNPVDNRVDVRLEYPEKAKPAETITVKIRLADPHGKPLPGEVTLWLVDQAVLALGKEQRLDPIPDFITPVVSRLSLHDTRDLPFGSIPFAENPGGEERAKMAGSLLDRATVRKNFKTVPYYNPAIEVGPDGVATVTVELPDNLTNFKIRAKAASGNERFGFATGQVSVRLPVIVQPALPRFVRPGDHFTASAVGRIVEGAGGPGQAQFRAQGVTLQGSDRREIAWKPDRPERLDFPVEVPTPPYDQQGRLSYDEVSLRIGVERASDGASDAFEAKLPVRDDRERVVRRSLADLKPGVPIAIPEVAEAARPGTIRREVLLSNQGGIVRMAAGLDFLLQYPYGCTEQRLSRSRAEIALKGFRSLLHQNGSGGDLERRTRETLEWIASAVDGDGLVAYWPGTPGTVSLTAWTVEFLVEARDAGYPVDAKLFASLTASLERALRSDYGHFIDGEAFAERAWALSALASAGKFNSAYAAELSRRARDLDLEGVAEVLQSFARAPETSPATIQDLDKQLWDGLVFRLFQGREIYGGLQERRSVRSGLILPSETRTLAEATRALARTDPANPRLPRLVEALVTLGRDDGWGSTNANASALLALSEILKPPLKSGGNAAATLRLEGREIPLAATTETPVGYFAGTSSAAGEVVLSAGSAEAVLRAETSYIPAADGSHVAPEASGFVVSREILKVGAAGEPPQKFPLASAGQRLTFAVGDVVEDHVTVVNPKDRHFVAVTVPLAAGMEPLNPHLATAPPEAAPSGKITLAPSYAEYLDDRVSFYYNTLPPGTYDFYFRTRATIPGSFTQPDARSEMMYDGSVRGNSAGARVEIERKAEK